MHRCRAQQRMHTLAQDRSIELIECCDYRPHRTDGTHAFIIPAAMGRASACYAPQPDKPLMCSDDARHPVRGRFCYSACIGLVPPHEVLSAAAGIFLVRDERHHELPGEVSLRKRGRSGHGSRDTALHVVATTTIYTRSFKPRLERGDVHAGGVHGVDMGTRYEHRTLICTRFRDRVASAGLDLIDPGTHAMSGQPSARELGDFALAAAFLRCKRWVDGGNADKALEKVQYGFA